MEKSLAVLVMFSFLIGQSVHGFESNPANNKVQKILKVPLIPTGYGVTKTQKNDYYLASLLIDKDALLQNADAEGIVYIDATKRMEFKFVADRIISGRTFARQLAAAIKINNTREEIKESKAQISRFIRFFRRSINKGDILRFDYHSSFGTRVYLNKRRLGEIPYSSVFYRVLLRMWLGNQPPSSQFKSGILGQNGDEYAISMQKRYKTT